MSDHFVNIDMNDILSAMDRLEQTTDNRFSDGSFFDGMMDHNDKNQIRTGIIQDPSYEQFQNRLDGEGNPLVQRSSHLTDEERPYPLNGVNSVDPLGMTVSIVWLDGQDGGLYNSVQTDSTPTDKVQKVILTFPQCWSDMDRSCGDFSLPLAGTVCRIAMGRNNVGVLLGTVPMDRGKLPQIGMGDFLRRHYTQNSHLITNQSTENAYKSVVNENIYRESPVCETRGTIDRPKILETRPEKLENIDSYHPHMLVQASDGISMSAKRMSGQHFSVDATRNMIWVNNLSLENSIAVANKSFKSIDNHDPENCSFSNVLMHHDVGSVEIINNDQNYVVSIISSDDVNDVMNQLKSSLSFQKLKTLRFMNDDVEVSAVYSGSEDISSVVSSLVNSNLKCVEVVLSTGKIIISYAGSLPQSLLYICNTTTSIAEGHISSFNVPSKTIIGSDGTKITEVSRRIDCLDLTINGMMNVNGTLNVVGPVNLTGIVNVTGSLLVNGKPVLTAP